MRRVKANDKLSFPVALDMGPFLAGDSTPPTGQPASPSQATAGLQAACLQYELAAILVHKGGSATQGHYGEPSLYVLRQGPMADKLMGPVLGCFHDTAPSRSRLGREWG